MSMSDREWMDEAPDYRLLSERRPIAAKDYACDWCWRPIQKGERYYHCAALVDGKFETVRSHAGGWQTCAGDQP